MCPTFLLHSPPVLSCTSCFHPLSSHSPVSPTHSYNKQWVKDKQQVSWLNKQITINKHPPCHTASGTELQAQAAPIRTLCFGHVTAPSLCLALFMTGRVSNRKGEKKDRERNKGAGKEWGAPRWSDTEQDNGGGREGIKRLSDTMRNRKEWGERRREEAGSTEKGWEKREMRLLGCDRDIKEGEKEKTGTSRVRQGDG